MKFRSVLTVCLTASALMAASSAFAQEAPKNPWDFSLSFSYLATSGNSDTQTGGTEFTFKRKPTPWGVEGGISYMQASQDGDKTAERAKAAVRGTRKVDGRWDVFLGGSIETDKFAGIHRRYVGEGGTRFNALGTERQDLSFDGGLTYTREEPTMGERQSYVGGLLGLNYKYKFAEKTAFTQRLVYFPNFKRGSDWRGESESALQAALNSWLALKVGVSVRYQNEPVPGFKKTDTTTTASLVLTF
jgi:putative salt-induced outer membrane protein